MTTLSAADEAAHAETMRSTERLSRRWTRARDALVVSVLHIAESVARQYARQGTTEAELSGAAFEGLLAAAEVFDPARGRFATAAKVYARKHVRKELQDSGIIRRPDRAVTERARVARAESSYVERFGHAPDDVWVASMAGINTSRLRDLRVTVDTVSLDAPAAGNVQLAERVPDECTSAGEAADVAALMAHRQAQHRVVARLLRCLPHRHAHALRSVNGAGVQDEATVSEYADGYTERHPSVVRAIARAAVDELRFVVSEMPERERRDMVEACGL